MNMEIDVNWGCRKKAETASFVDGERCCLAGISWKTYQPAGRHGSKDCTGLSMGQEFTEPINALFNPQFLLSVLVTKVKLLLVLGTQKHRNDLTKLFGFAVKMEVSRRSPQQCHICCESTATAQHFPSRPAPPVPSVPPP